METLFQDIVRALGWSILNSIWQSGIIYSILLLILLLTPKLKSSYRHNLSFGALMMMLTWFIHTFAQQLAQAGKSIKSGVNLNVYELNTYIQNLPKTFSEKAESYFPIVFIMYLLGIAIQFILVFKGFSHIQKMKNHGISVVPVTWLELFEKAKLQLKLNRNIQFKLSDRIDVPMVVGYFKPIVLFPVSLVTFLEQEQVEAILIHELSHIRRNDYLLNIVKTCTETVLFFNPFIWLTSRFIQIEREHACDDLVVNISGKPLSYAKTLLKLEIIQQEKTPSYVLAATGKTQHLYQRIKRITNMKANYLNVKQQFAALTLALAGLLSIAWTNPKVQEKAAEITQKLEVIEVFGAQKTASADARIDTVKKKSSVKITVTDEDGKTTSYTQLTPLKDSALKFKAYAEHRKSPSRQMIISGSVFIDDSTYKKVHFKARPFKMNPDSILAVKVLKALPGIEITTKDGKTEIIKLGETLEAKMNGLAKEVEVVGRASKSKTMQVENSWSYIVPDLNNKVMIRGGSSNTAKSPTIIVNGDTVSNQMLSNINVDRIANISVIKNSSASPNGTIEISLADPASILKEMRTHEKTDRELRATKEYQALKNDFDKKLEALKKKQQKKKSDN